MELFIFGADRESLHGLLDTDLFKAQSSSWLLRLRLTLVLIFVALQSDGHVPDLGSANGLLNANAWYSCDVPLNMLGGVLF